MGTSLDHLLPAVDEVLRCAEHARRIDVDPGGTALRADRIVLVAASLPWPKPALDHPAVRPVAEALGGTGVPTRVLAFVPEGPGSAAAGDGATVVVYEREGPSAVERRYRTATPAESADLARALAADGAAPLPAPMAEHRPARPAVLVCTQGSHDVCCGSEGTRLAGELQARNDATAAASGGSDHAAQLYRVSHTGGHRFAPTAMTLPDGRMWAGLTVARVESILTRSGDLADLAATCRGWWGADGGPAQVAERAVLAARGWSLDDHERRVELAENPGTGAAGSILATVTVSPAASPAPAGPPGGAEGERWEVELSEGRSVPTIACRQPGGLPAKPAREYDVVAVRRLG
ncbi:MAG: sucrase ferredoxin [Acidimicrobiales bacterium]